MIIALLNEPVENLSEFLTALLAQLDFPPIQVLADAVTMLTETEQLLNKQSHIQLTAAYRGIEVELFVGLESDHLIVNHAQRSYYQALLASAFESVSAVSVTARVANSLSSFTLKPCFILPDATP